MEAKGVSDIAGHPGELAVQLHSRPSLDILSLPPSPLFQANSSAHFCQWWPGTPGIKCRLWAVSKGPGCVTSLVSSLAVPSPGSLWCRGCSLLLSFLHDKFNPSYGPLGGLFSPHPHLVTATPSDFFRTQIKCHLLQLPHTQVPISPWLTGSFPFKYNVNVLNTTKLYT